MHWILQDNLFNEEAYQTLLDTLERFGLPHSIHKVIPFVGELVPEPELMTKNVICMGSYSLRHAAKKAGWAPGVFDLEPFDFTVQRARWGRHMLNHDSVVSTFAAAHFPSISICSAHQERDPKCSRCNVLISTDAFIRPIQDSKVFAGKVYSYDEFTEWQHKVVDLKEDYGNSLTKDTLVQVCEPKVIYGEYRFWIVHGQIVTASMYKRGNRVHYIDQVDQCYHDFVRDRILTWQPHAAFVIDVCDTPEGIKIVEINTLNSCGFYAADIPKLVMALEDGFSA